MSTTFHSKIGSMPALASLRWNVSVAEYSEPTLVRSITRVAGGMLLAPPWNVSVMLPVVAALAWAIGWGNFHAPETSWIRTPVIVVLYFFGGLWVLALGEEFFFRGLLQQWMIGWLRNQWAGLLVTSLLFGSVHLWYRSFPNWRFALLAAVAGVFYGLAFRQASSIRASMVTHALTITTVRVFFS